MIILISGGGKALGFLEILIVDILPKYTGKMSIYKNGAILPGRLIYIAFQTWPGYTGLLFR
jgi:hypothetical protein